MTNERHVRPNDAGAAKPVGREREELAGPGRADAASGPVPGQRSGAPMQAGENSNAEGRHTAEADLETLRATVTNLERELAMVRADLERLRQESERAAGSKLP